MILEYFKIKSDIIAQKTYLLCLKSKFLTLHVPTWGVGTLRLGTNILGSAIDTLQSRHEKEPHFLLYILTLLLDFWEKKKSSYIIIL